MIPPSIKDVIVLLCSMGTWDFLKVLLDACANNWVKCNMCTEEMCQYVVVYCMYYLQSAGLCSSIFYVVVLYVLCSNIFYKMGWGALHLLT